MICYHGSDTIVDIPRILEAKRPLDFGGGFYVTTSNVCYESSSLLHRRGLFAKFDFEPPGMGTCVGRFGGVDT